MLRCRAETIAFSLAVLVSPVGADDESGSKVRTPSDSKRPRNAGRALRREFDSCKCPHGDHPAANKRRDDRAPVAMENVPELNLFWLSRGNDLKRRWRSVRVANQEVVHRFPELSSYCSTTTDSSA